MSGAHDYKFNRSVFRPVDDSRVTMNGMTLLASNIWSTSVGLEYFVVTGQQYRYVVTVWAPDDKIKIDVYGGNSATRKSSIYPRNQSELLETINTIAKDFEERLDLAEATA